MHASVVTFGSEYFRAMLEHAMVESGSRSFELQEVQPCVFERVVEWLYTGELGEISDVAEGVALLEVSRFLRVERLEAQCCAWICAHLDASNCVAVWAEASRLGCSVVTERAMIVIGRRLASVAGEAQFLELPREAFLELARSDGLAAWREREVYEAAMGWVRHDAELRKGWLGEVLGAVRMALLPPAYLANTVRADPLVRESSEAMRIVVDAQKYSQLKGVERAAVESGGLSRRRKHAMGGELVVVGGMGDNHSILKNAEMYNGLTGLWRAMPEMSVERRGCAAVCIEGSVYVVGGNNGRSDLRSAEVYDASVGLWHDLPEMSVARNGCVAVSMEGGVYVMGGSDRSARKSAEVYDVSTGQWRALPDMSVARRGSAAVSMEGSVYVMGGFKGDSALKSAEVYDGSAGQWHALPDMSVARNGCAAVGLDGNVYVMGGYDGRIRLKSAEVYDRTVGQWRALPDMSVARYGCAAVSFEGIVCVMGGHSIDLISSMECYDPEANEWRMLPSMSNARSFCAAAGRDVP